MPRIEPLESRCVLSTLFDFVAPAEQVAVGITETVVAPEDGIGSKPAPVTRQYDAELVYLANESPAEQLRLLDRVGVPLLKLYSRQLQGEQVALEATTLGGGPYRDLFSTDGVHPC